MRAGHRGNRRNPSLWNESPLLAAGACGCGLVRNLLYWPSRANGLDRGGYRVKSSVTLVFSGPRVPQGVPAFRRMVDNLLAAVAGVPAVIIPHLYDLAPGGPVFRYLRQLDCDLILLAPLFPRAAHLVLRANGLRYRLAREDEFPGQIRATKGLHRLWVYDYRDYLSVEVLKQAVTALLSSLADQGELLLPVADSAPLESAVRELEEPIRPRWYPVIDEERCTNCYECLNFCLFGVYDVSENGGVFVAQPDACRPGCPACARVCPTGAIVFPLYPDPAIAGGGGGNHEGKKGDGDRPQPPSGAAVEEAEKWRAQFASDVPTGQFFPGRSAARPGKSPDDTSGRMSSAQDTPSRSGPEERPSVRDDLIDRWLSEAEEGPDAEHS